MKVTAQLNCNLDLVNASAECTVHGSKVNAPLKIWFQTEHSPIRMIRFWAVAEDIKTFVSVHLVRHGMGVGHYVKSNRDDRGGSGVIDRDTPVTHGIEINAEALISMSRKRLCYMSHTETVSAMTKIKNAVGKVCPELPPYMVPNCVYRNGICPEVKECSVGMKKVMNGYKYYPGLYSK